jgi:hypothetical protein
MAILFLKLPAHPLPHFCANTIIGTQSNSSNGSFSEAGNPA